MTGTDNIFLAVKERVPIRAACEKYGIRLKGNKAPCPLHSERTPSFTIYPETNSFYCFGCHEGGDTITLIGKMYGVNPLESAKIIAGDFGITEPAPKRSPVANIVKEFDVWQSSYFKWLCDWIDKAEGLIKQLAPKTKDEPFCDTFANLVHQSTVYEMHRHVLMYGDFEDKARLYSEGAALRKH